MRYALLAAIPIIPAAWVASASAIYLTGVGKISLFVFPYAQWLEAVRWWTYTYWITLWVVVGALVPTLVVGLIVLIILRRWSADMTRDSLYGTTGWASQDDMIRGGLQVRKRF